VALGGAMTTPNNLRSGNGSASGNGATGSGGTTRGGVIGHPLVHKVHCLNLTQLWNSSVMDCDGITRWLGLKSYEVCRILYVSYMKAYNRPMHGCVGWWWLHKVLRKPKESSFGMGSWTKSIGVRYGMPCYYNLPNPLWQVLVIKKKFKWTWWRNGWSSWGSTKKTQRIF